MKISDMFAQSLKSLRRRRLRTLLTVLGVVIGTASVVTMLSLGYGMEKMTEDMYASFGSMNMISVSAPYNDDSKQLTDKLVSQFEKLQHVDYVSPALNINVILKQGSYKADTQLVGVTQRYLEDIELGSGEIPKKGELSLVMGNMIKIYFNKEHSRENYWETGVIPDVDYSRPLYIIYDTPGYYASSGSNDAGKPAPKKYVINVSGEVAGGIETWTPSAYLVYTDLDALKAQLKAVFKKNPIPGQPTNKKGKPYGYFVYDQVYVYCDNMNNVVDVQKQITNLGYNASSNMEWLNQSKEQMNMISAALGGIGAISLLVAAIGIANTMMMSIYERTKEIGITKVLGCDMNEIRNLFLIESGFIGLIGGLLGVGLSYLLSYIVNNLGMSQSLMGLSGNLSLIPVWLAPTAIGFAIIISMAAGFAPSVKAMKLSPLEAIRNE